MSGAVIGGIIGGIAGGLAVLILALFQKPLKCPECGEPVPRLRKAANRRQAMWGGATCAKCGCEMDRKGRKIESDS